MYKTKADYDKICSLCEHGWEFSDPEFRICVKKGLVSPGGSCKKFYLDPLKIQVSIPKLPAFDQELVITEPDPAAPETAEFALEEQTEGEQSHAEN